MWDGTARQQPQDFGLTGLLAVVGAGLLGAKGAKDANQTNLLLSEENRKWQEAMADTAYQRAVRDLAKAGLNPMLAYSQGGSAVPSQDAPQVANQLGPAVSSALQGASLMSTAQQMQLSAEQAQLARAQAAKVTSETVSNDLHSAMMAARVKQTMSQTKLTDAHWDNVQQQILGTIADSATKHAVFQEMNKGGGFAADVARRKAESEIARYGVAEAKSGSQFYEGLGQANPYLRMLIEALRGISGIRR